MATGAQVPWTDPGGEPCCCQDACYTDFANEPLSPYSDDSWAAISSTDYASMLAGGTYSTAINIDVTGSNLTLSERHIVDNVTVSLDLSESLASNCYQRHGGSVEVTRTISSSPNNFDYTADILFARSLGTSNGNPHLSLATVCPPPSTFPASTFASITLSGLSALTFGVGVFAHVGDFTSFVTGLCRDAQIFCESSLIVGASTYVATGTTIACFQTLTSMSFITHTGTMSFVTTFTPSAP